MNSTKTTHTPAELEASSTTYPYNKSDIMQIIGRQYINPVCEHKDYIKEIFKAHNTILNDSLFLLATDMFLYGIMVGKHTERQRKHEAKEVVAND